MYDLLFVLSYLFQPCLASILSFLFHIYSHPYTQIISTHQLPIKLPKNPTKITPSPIKPNAIQLQQQKKRHPQNSMQKSPNNRNKTTNQFPHPQVIKKQHKSKSKMRRKLSIQLRSHTQDNTQQNDFYQVCYTPTAPISHNKMMDKGDREAQVNFSTRNSGKINGLFLGKRKEKSGLEVAVGEIRKGFLRVSYRDKLEQIAGLFIRVKELVKIHGYFYITFSMLKFNMTSTPKITPHIHPDTRSTKPLHPIKKPNKFQCELECVQELKNIIRTILPTIDLGDIKTFNNIIAYIQRLIKQLDQRRKKMQSSKNNTKNQNNIKNQNQKISDVYAVEGRREKQQGRYGSGNRNMFDGCQYRGGNGQSEKQERSASRDIVNKMGKRDYQKERERERQRQREIRQFTLGVQDKRINEESNEDVMQKKQRMDQRIKETKSTLMQSFRSINSIQEKVKMELQKSKQFQIGEDPRRQRKTSWISERKKQQQRISPNPKQNYTQNFPPTPNLTPLPSPNILQLQLQPILQQAPISKQNPIPNSNSNTNTNIVMRTSVSGRKLMSMSIEMQSQINNLFNGEDTPLSCLYLQHNQRRQVKNSMLSRVAEEFQDLF